MTPTRMGHDSMNLAGQDKTTPLKRVGRLTADDLEALCDEAERQNRSLACLLGAMIDSEPIAWMEKEN